MLINIVMLIHCFKTEPSSLSLKPQKNLGADASEFLQIKRMADYNVGPLKPRGLNVDSITHGHYVLQLNNRFLGIIGQNPSVPKSNRFHAVTFGFFLIDFKYIL